ncbi:MAG: Kelch repeat-containing protein [Acidimicrobiales bacterium]
MDSPGALQCTRHLTPTRITCVTCDTPICPVCAIRTEVGLKCPDHASRPSAPTRSKWSALAVLLVLVAIVGFSQLARSTGRGDPSTPRCPTETAPDVGIGSSGGGHWREMSPTSLCGRYDASAVWTGQELLVWGGESCAGAACPNDRAPHLGDGAAYNVANDAWRKLADSPLPNREAAATVWTGTEMLVWGGTTGQTLLADGAAYDPAEDTWRPLAASPLSPRTGSAAAWTGREMVVWGGSDTADGAAYDPAADRWRPIATGPLTGRSLPVVSWTGRELIVWSGSRFRDGAAYDPAGDRWRTIAASPLAGRFAAASVWTGRELLVWGGDSEQTFVTDDGAAYDPATDQWRPLPPAPVGARAAAAVVWSGREMIVWGGVGQPGAGENSPLDTIVERRTLLSPVNDGAAYDPAVNRWRTLEPVPLLGRGFPVAAWDGQGMLVWGGLVVVSSPASAAEGVRYTP